MRVGDRSSWTRELIEDLLQRKVDTIVTDGITGRAMPHPIIALLDLNNTYLRKLIKVGVVGNDQHEPDDARDAQGWLPPTSAAQKWLVEKALKGLQDPALKPSDGSVLQRIVSTCTALMPIVAALEQRYATAFRAELRTSLPAPGRADVNPTRQYYAMGDWSTPLPDIELSRREHSALSKAWELGSDTVAMQTVSMLEGDIITRITEQYSTETYAIVRQIHREAVNVSLSTWELLAKSVGSFVEALFSRKP